MGFVEAVKAFFSNYTNFKGRAIRSEFWWANLFMVLAATVLMIPAMGGIMSALTQAAQTGAEPSMSAFFSITSIPLILFYLAIIIPSISLSIRRFHDRGQTGWLVLAYVVCSMIPVVGLIVMIAYIVNFCLRGTVGDNKYGPDALGGSA